MKANTYYFDHNNHAHFYCEYVKYHSYNNTCSLLSRDPLFENYEPRNCIIIFDERFRRWIIPVKWISQERLHQARGFLYTINLFEPITYTQEPFDTLSKIAEVRYALQ